MTLANKVKANVVTFGFSEKADAFAYDVVSVPEKGNSFKARILDQHLEIMLPVPGIFNIHNALAAAVTATLLGAPPEAIQKGLEEFHPSPMRMEIHTTVTGVP